MDAWMEPAFATTAFVNIRNYLNSIYVAFAAIVTFAFWTAFRAMSLNPDLLTYSPLSRSGST